MRFVHMGSTNKMIARTLGISEGTVKPSRQHLPAARRRKPGGRGGDHNGWLSPHLEVLLANRDRAGKPAIGERGLIPLRKHRNDRRYPSPAANAGPHDLPIAAEPSVRFRRER
jgi:hypothetical protein